VQRFFIKALFFSYGFFNAFAEQVLPPSQKIVLNEILVQIDGQPITLRMFQEFEKEIPIRAMLDPLFIKFFGSETKPSNDQAAWRLKVLQFMVHDRIVQSSLIVSDDEVDSDILANQRSLRLSESEFTKSLQMAGITFAQYRRNFKSAKAWQNLARRELYQKLTVTDAQLREYYRQKKMKEHKPLKKIYDLKFITILTKSYKDKASALKIAEQVLKELKQSKWSFDAMIARFHEDIDLMPHGTLKMQEDELSKEMLEAIAKLGKGQVTPHALIMGDKIHIIKLEDVKVQEERFDDIKEALQIELMDELTYQGLSEWLEKKKKPLHIHYNKSLDFVR
jgi:parvulin-like peptidyl-prolyl isomerase